MKHTLSSDSQLNAYYYSNYLISQSYSKVKLYYK